MELTEILAISSIAISILGLLFQYFKWIVTEEKRISTLETKMGLFWNLVEKNFPKILHSPHTPSLDTLLDKMSERTLNLDEAQDLREQLKCELTGKVAVRSKDNELLVIVMLLGRLEQIIYDFKVKQETKILA